MLMIVLGYSGLDGSVEYARRDPDLRTGEERMAQGFDSAAALLVDGRIVAAAAEERFSLEKHTNAFPRHSIRYCLDAAGIAADDLDGVAHGFDYAQYADFFRHFDAAYYASVLAPDQQTALWKENFSLDLTSRGFKSIDHHLAHAASGYYQSGFDEALCLVADGMGEVTALTLYTVRNGAFEKLDSFPIQSSVGILYSLVTVHLGFKFNADEYKVMGLAPYGDPTRYRHFFASITEFSENGKYAIRLDRLSTERGATYRGVLKYLDERIIPAGEPDGSLLQSHRDFAAAAQECLEKILFHVLEHWRAKTGMTKFCMAGGVALNCTFNGKLLQRGLFEDAYVQPAAGDDGTALGAACVLARQNGESLAAANVGEMPFYGPVYSKAEIRAAIERFADRVEFVDLGSAAAAAEDAARTLVADKVVAWFQGRMEYGPRALGNRSILANPLSPDIKERLNSIVKLREGFRPFAPAATAERAADYFEYHPSSLFDYMLAICTVRPEWRARLPGVTHVDGSARLQTVGSRKNPLFHQLIACFGELSGVHCVVNTSFNVRGQPMIVSPEIAIETFLKVKIDQLHLEAFRITKKDAQ
jgi:carbamoyltransferase